jgi:hypothetical protein
MSGAIALVILIVAALIWIGGRSAKRALRRHRPGLPPPDRACTRDCFKPVARQ